MRIHQLHIPTHLPLGPVNVHVIDADPGLSRCFTPLEHVKASVHLKSLARYGSAWGMSAF
jgi:hypothetical protein